MRQCERKPQEGSFIEPYRAELATGAVQGYFPGPARAAEAGKRAKP